MKKTLLGIVSILLILCCAACGQPAVPPAEGQAAEPAKEQAAEPVEGAAAEADNELYEKILSAEDGREDEIPVEDAPVGNAPDDENSLEEIAEEGVPLAVNPADADRVDAAPAEDQSLTQKATGSIEEPVGYLKDKVTEKGVLGEDYPVLSYYGWRSSMNGQISSYHRGMDFYMEEGTALVTPCDCLIKYTGYNETRGYWIVMYWGNGYYIVYQHLSKILVREGFRLAKGNKVGYSGNTGASLTPHLHLEILQCDTGGDDITDFNEDDIRINPYYFVFGNESTYSKPEYGEYDNIYLDY